MFQNRIPFQCSGEARVPGGGARIPEDGGSCGQSAVYHLRDFFSWVTNRQESYKLPDNRSVVFSSLSVKQCQVHGLAENSC